MSTRSTLTCLDQSAQGKEALPTVFSHGAAIEVRLFVSFKIFMVPKPQHDNNTRSILEVQTIAKVNWFWRHTEVEQ